MLKRGRSAILSVGNVIFLDSLTCYVVKLWIKIVDCKIQNEYEILSIHGQHNMLGILVRGHDPINILTFVINRNPIFISPL